MTVQIGAIQHLKRRNQRGKFTARSWVVEDGKKRGVTASGDTREAAGIALRAKLDALDVAWVSADTLHIVVGDAAPRYAQELALQPA